MSERQEGNDVGNPIDVNFDYIDCIEEPAVKGFSERLGEVIVNITGTMSFAYVITLFIFAWMMIEVISERATTDTFNLDFPVLMTVMTVIQVLLPTFILVGQAQQMSRAKARERGELRWRRNRVRESIDLQNRLVILMDMNKDILREMQIQQEAILNIQGERLAFYGSVSNGLLETISDMTKDIKNRPCLLERIDPDVVEKIVRRSLSSSEPEEDDRDVT